MRIVHLISYATFSGPLPGTLGLAQAQRALGHTVFVAHDSRRGAFSPYEEGAERHMHDEAERLPIRLSLAPRRRLLAAAIDVIKLRAWFKSGDIDVVHTHQSHDHALVAAAGTHPAARVRTLHKMSSLKSTQLMRGLSRGLMRRCEALIVRSPDDAVRLRAHLSPHKLLLACIPGGFAAKAFARAVELQRPQRQVWRQQRNIPNGVKLLGHVALMAHRGQEELVDAIAGLGDAGQGLHAVFMGQGPQYDALQQRVRALGLEGRLHFAGYVPVDALPQAYAALDAAYVARPGNDGACRSALEASAAGLPIVCCASQSLADINVNMGALVFDTVAPPHIRAAIAAWLRSPKNAHEQAQRRRHHVETHRDFVIEAKSTIALYQKLDRVRPLAEL